MEDVLPSPAPREQVVTGRLRRRAEAVLVGAATVIADDPSLTVRHADGTAAEHQPLRVVLVGQHVPSVDSCVFTDGQAPTLVLAGDRAPEGLIGEISKVAEVQRFSAADGVEGALRALGNRGIGEVLVEPGPRLLSALWERRLIDVLVSVVAGGMAGPDSPAPYAGGRDARDSVLTHVLAPVEAGIVGDVSVTLWCPNQDAAVQ